MTKAVRFHWAVLLLVAVALLAPACGSGAASTTLSTPQSPGATTSTTTVSSTTALSSTSTVSSTTTLPATSTTRVATTSPPTTSASPYRLAIPNGTLSLTAEQLAGQRIIYSYKGATPPAELLDRIRTGRAAGVIFFSDNIGSLSHIRSVIGQLQKANASASNPVRAPLLLMTDQEGGALRRLPGAPVLSEKQIGASADPLGEATSAGSGAGQNLKGAGLNVNLAPVLDVYRRAGDFDDKYGRSYSTDPAVVSSLGSAFITAQQKVGIAATAKHFPGLGVATSSQNTDLGPVTLALPLSTLRSVDESPFRAAIAAGVRLVMVSWAIYPALDPSLPAGLSTKVVQGELRDRLGFEGVTITDGLGAGALPATEGFGLRARRAADAGMDLLLCAATVVHDVFQGDAARENLVTGLSGGGLDQTAFRQAAERVVSLRYSLTP